ncbi:SPOR domain-containing protein [Candidatus Omnitrophota bacterium]
MSKEQLSFFEDAGKERRMIALSMDKLYLVGIVLLVALIAAFSMGVERGRRLNLAGLDTQNIEEQAVTKDIFPPEPIPFEPAISVPAAVVETVKVAVVKEIKPQAAAPEPADQSLYYSIQVASYKNRATAETEAKDLKSKGYEPVYVKPGDTWTALCVGKFKTIDDARGLAKRLRSRYSDCFIRKL